MAAGPRCVPRRAPTLRSVRSPRPRRAGERRRPHRRPSTPRLACPLLEPGAMAGVLPDCHAVKSAAELAEWRRAGGAARNLGAFGEGPLRGPSRERRSKSPTLRNEDMTHAARAFHLPPHLPPEGAAIWRQVVGTCGKPARLRRCMLGLWRLLCWLCSGSARSTPNSPDRTGRSRRRARRPVWRAIEASAGTVKSMARALGLAAAGRGAGQQQPAKNGAGDVWSGILG